MISRFEIMGWKHTSLTWRLATDLAVRSVSRDQKMPTFLGHMRWMARWMGSSDRAVLVAYIDDSFLRGERSIGIIRMSKDVTGVGEVGISLLEDARGEGNGSDLIKIGVPYLARMLDVQRAYACMRSDNIGSYVAFRRAGFVKEQQDDEWAHLYRTV
jgi:RimJ/RimL family protein N-acetyltransferase